ncbi:MAG: 2,3,4,5-tetrahydropyridine-2,6-dicarboxylate N-succinyltransferase [Longimicrobiales bacterium]|nr:2,3,4,5-tetrahydropyridine-2,6-dicarboxylate N-succinyltransferase [Longimicrobiales bacterium]
MSGDALRDADALRHLEVRITRWAEAGMPSGTSERAEVRRDVAELLEALERGVVRAALPGPEGWAPVPWVKQGILLAFKAGETRAFVPHPPAANPDFGGSTFRYADRDTLPLRATDGPAEGVRIVPGGSSVRAGAHLGRGVVIMPPAYVNVGAYVGAGAMVDSHALVGSCAQVGERVHLSAGAQLGGVLEPIGMRPVIVEDDCMIGANTGIFEGTLVEAGAVLAPGVQLTASTTVFDLVRDRTYRAAPGRPLTIPAGAVVVPGSRPAAGDAARRHGVHLYVPVIVKYRDARTNAATALEEALR